MTLLVTLNKGAGRVVPLLRSNLATGVGYFNNPMGNVVLYFPSGSFVYSDNLRQEICEQLIDEINEELGIDEDFSMAGVPGFGIDEEAILGIQMLQSGREIKVSYLPPADSWPSYHHAHSYTGGITDPLGFNNRPWTDYRSSANSQAYMGAADPSSYQAAPASMHTIKTHEQNQMIIEHQRRQQAGWHSFNLSSFAPESQSGFRWISLPKPDVSIRLSTVAVTHFPAAQEMSPELQTLLQKYQIKDKALPTPEVALRRAAFKNNVQDIRALVQKFKVDINAQSDLESKNGGFTALHWACKEGRGDAVTALLDLGADKNLLNENKQTAKELATSGVQDLPIWSQFEISPV